MPAPSSGVGRAVAVVDEHHARRVGEQLDRLRPGSAARWNSTFADIAWPTYTGTRTHVAVTRIVVVVQDLAASR